MLKFNCYSDNSDNKVKFIFSIDWFKFEDRWTQRYMFDRPMLSDDMMERVGIRNLNRAKWFKISINVMGRVFSVNFRLGKVGNNYYGREMHDGPRSLKNKENVK